MRYSIFAVWFGVLVTGFVFAGGIKGVDPLRLTERYVSVDEPLKYIMYYLVLGRFSCSTLRWVAAAHATASAG